MSGARREAKFTLIQAGRGIAAAWVVLFHIEKTQNISHLTALWPDWITAALFGYGSAGMAIFFVLSGFVITHSLSQKDMNGREFGKFVVRRSVRLDPPYWVSILLAVAVAAALAIAKKQPIPWPDGLTVILHLLYLQELLNRPEIQIVYWTLTYEIQFYLMLAGALWLVSALQASRMDGRWARIVAFWPLTLLAFASAALPSGWAPHGLFVNLWHGFFVGVLAYEAGRQRHSPVIFLALCGLMLVVAQFREGVFNTPCAAAALVLFMAARTGWLERGLSARPYQMLGTISYSLYLVHVPVLIMFFAAWGLVAGRGTAQDLIGFVLLCATILAAASLFWWLIERPSHALAKRLWRSPAPTEVAPALQHT